MRNVVTIRSAAYAAILVAAVGSAQAESTTLYENFGGDLFSVDLQTHTQLGHFSGAGANLTAVNGHVYWQDGRRIYEANPDLTTVSSIFFSVLTPTDFTVEDLSSAVPELSTWVMLLVGFTGLGYAGCREARRSNAALSSKQQMAQNR